MKLSLEIILKKGYMCYRNVGSERALLCYCYCDTILNVMAAMHCA